MTQLIFKEEPHLYQTVGDESVKWTSVTSLIERYGNPFDDVAMAEKVAGKKKYRKLDAEGVLDLWHKENKRSTEMGTKFHAIKESELYEDKTLELPIFRSQSDKEGNKLSGSPVLEEGYYPELLVFFESANICGQSDLVCIKDNKVHILDYKGLDLNTDIPTKGGFKKLKDINVGDIIFDRNGEYTKIKHVSSIHYNPCYKIKFDTNDEIVCDHEHKWVVSKRIQKKQKGKIIHSFEECELITEQLFELLNKGEILRIKCSSPILCEEKKLPIDPYLFGLWLGDGNKYDGTITQVNKKVWEELEKRGCKLSINYSRNNHKAETRRIFGLRSKLKKLNLLKNKHLPDLFLFSTYKQRLDIIRGLMDSDGYYNKSRKRCVMVTTQEWQAKALCKLISSIGWKPTVIKSKTMCYNVYFIPINDNPFLCRNFDCLNNTTKKHSCSYEYRYIKQVIKVDTLPTKCLAVDSDTHTYLFGHNFIMTHNTNKRLDFNSFNDYKKGRLMMFPPVNNLEDCNFNHYQLQLSMYMYIILQQNPKLSPGSLIIDHYQFEKEGDDEYDYPIYKFDSYGNPIVKEKKRYACKYMQREVKRIIDNFLENDKVI